VRSTLLLEALLKFKEFGCEATVAVLHGAQFELAKDQRLNRPRKSRGLALG
jgi:hypothetical protein